MVVPSMLHLVPEREGLATPPPGIGGARAVSDKWRLTREGFDKFLLKLDPGDRDAAGRKYEILRSKLISYFDWRNCPFPEDHADEALSRVIRKIEAGEELRDASIYVFGVARMMLLEIARRMEKERMAFSQLPLSSPIDAESDEMQERIASLIECLEILPAKSRHLITEYYQGDTRDKINRRKELAAKLEMPINALRIRACRLRDKLEECMGRGMAGKRI